MVAEFGWLRIGRVLLLENVAPMGGKPDFKMHDLDPRHGSIHVPTVDLNGDGRLDFVALIAQQHESVDAFLNEGDGTFVVKPIFAAPTRRTVPAEFNLSTWMVTATGTCCTQRRRLRSRIPQDLPFHPVAGE